MLAQAKCIGQPLSELKYLPPVVIGGSADETLPGNHPKNTFRAPNEITFVRNRMLYARAALNAYGRVRFGLRHIRKFALKNGGAC